MRKYSKQIFLFFLVVVITSLVTLQGNAQASTAQFSNVESKYWINTYGNIRLKGNFFWDMQTHLRFQEKGNVPLFGQWAQIYNRQGLGYIFSKNFNSTVGFVFRLNNNLDGVESNEQQTVSDWRIWHQYQFAMPFPRFNVYHRLRIEHRWSRGFASDSDYFFRNRYRYMLNVKIPINKRKLEEKTLYVAPEVELIMQSGRRVVNSPFEDLRLHTSVGYILNHRVILASGLMYTMGQELFDGAIYKQGFVLRTRVYYFMDSQKWKKQKLPFSLLE